MTVKELYEIAKEKGLENAQVQIYIEHGYEMPDEEFCITGITRDFNNAQLVWLDCEW